MKRFHITIKNNEIGETLLDLDTNAIVAGILDDDGSFSIGHTHCNADGLLSTICSAEKAINQLLKKHPQLLLLKMLTETEEATDETTETTEN